MTATSPQRLQSSASRESTASGPGAVAIGGRYQKKLGRRYLLQFDGYVSGQETQGPKWGLRSEIQVRF